MLKLRPSALVSSRTAVDLPCEIETIRPSDSSCCMVRISIVILLPLRPVYFGSRATIPLVPGEGEAVRKRPTYSRDAEGVVPCLSNAAEERRIHDPLAERVDEAHVHGRQAADALHVHAEIEAVGGSRLDEGAQRCSVRGTVPQLEELLVFEAIHDSKGPLARARLGQGPRKIGGRQTGGESLLHGRGALAIPAEEPAHKEPNAQERAHDRRGCEWQRTGHSHELVQRDPRPSPRQIDDPHVVERHASEEVMNPEWEPSELLRRDTWHRAYPE